MIVVFKVKKDLHVQCMSFSCAFVKLPSLKDSKRVITEMNGFPYKGLKMEIRFSAAADFMDYTVPNSGKFESWKGLFVVVAKKV